MLAYFLPFTGFVGVYLDPEPCCNWIKNALDSHMPEGVFSVILMTYPYEALDTIFIFQQRLTILLFSDGIIITSSNAGKIFNDFSTALGEPAGIIFSSLYAKMNSDLKDWLANPSNILLLLACC